MCSARFNGHIGKRGVCLGGVYPGGCTPPPLQTELQTENITFPQLLLRMVKWRLCNLLRLQITHSSNFSTITSGNFRVKEKETKTTQKHFITISRTVREDSQSYYHSGNTNWHGILSSLFSTLDMRVTAAEKAVVFMLMSLCISAALWLLTLILFCLRNVKFMYYETVLLFDRNQKNNSNIIIIVVVVGVVVIIIIIIIIIIRWTLNTLQTRCDAAGTLTFLFSLESRDQVVEQTLASTTQS